MFQKHKLEARSIEQNQNHMSKPAQLLEKTLANRLGKTASAGGFACLCGLVYMQFTIKTKLCRVAVLKAS